MKTYIKTLFRMFKKQVTKMFSIMFILLLSIGIVVGVGAGTIKVADSVTEYYISSNVSDLIVKSTKVNGFSSDEILKLKEEYGANYITTSTSFDLEVDKEVIRYYYLDFDNININKLELIEGSFPKTNNEIVVERKTGDIKSYKVGDKFDYNGISYDVVGIVKNPLYFQNLEEPSYIEDKNLDRIIYFMSNSYVPINEISISFKNRNLINNMEDDYEKLVNKEKVKIETLLSDIEVLSLYENVSFYKVYVLADKVGIIAIVLLIGFMLVSGLVVLSTMSRLIEEERKGIACLKILGYSDFSILFKYLLFGFISTIIGGVLAYFVGVSLAGLIYYNFDAFFDMPKMSKVIDNGHYLITFVVLVISTLLVTYNTASGIICEKPAEMIKRKPPKVSKKILLERITFIWDKLSFKYKSTLRNIFRYKKYFIMTVVSIMGSTILVFLGTGLLSYSFTDELFGDAITFICIIVVIFAGLLAILVIYTLTNINISERYKEISTLMVLGYHDNEVTGYIYREIYIMCFIGIILGIPFGHILLDLIFEVLEFGSMSDVSLWVYVITPLFVIIFMFIITFILRWKIVSIDINESLKEVE